MTRSIGVTVVLAAVLVSAAGCSKKDASSDPPLAPAASSLAPSTAAPASMAARYEVEKTGKTLLDMPAPKEHIKADTTASGGSIEVDLKNLANTRGEVKVDLTTLSTHTFGSDKDKDQTKHARTWLEVGDAVDDAAREKNGWAVFAIRTIDGLNATDAAKLPSEKDGVGEFRTVSLTAHGEFLLHGRKVNKDAQLIVRLRYPAGASADSKPVAVEIKTKEPFVVTLAEHDVKPRDTFGKFAQGSLGLLGTKVADTAAVTLDLRAIPAS